MALVNGAVDNYDILKNSSGVHVDLAVAGVTTVYTKTFICKKGVTYGLEYKFTSVGVVACDIFLEQGNSPPATEGAVSTNMVTPDGFAAIAADVGEQLVHITQQAPVVANFLRFRIVGKGLNNAGTVLERLLVNSIVDV